MRWMDGKYKLMMIDNVPIIKGPWHAQEKTGTTQSEE